MLYLFCVDYDGRVGVKSFDSCAERDAYYDRLDLSKYSEVIDINGDFDFRHIVHKMPAVSGAPLSSEQRAKLPAVSGAPLSSEQRAMR